MPDEFEISELVLCADCGALIPEEMKQEHHDFHEAVIILSQITKQLTAQLVAIKQRMRSSN